MPFPQNLEVALSVESIICKIGAVPATIGCLKGRLHVGMSQAEIELLAKAPKVAKISRRDFAVVTARSLTGGTTIAGTMVLAHMAGIKVFATGVSSRGLVGIDSRDWGVFIAGESFVCLTVVWADLAMDISADLEEFGRTPVAVISSGAKAILDIGRTLEYLETKGVTVTTIGEEGIDVPAFYSRNSGIKSPFNSPTIEDAARLIRNHPHDPTLIYRRQSIPWLAIWNCHLQSYSRRIRDPKGRNRGRD
jgi:pseudouridine-5'-phosphate glycosidase/pseudouridine kinase